jgi:amino acid adenylation domain-containing protein
VSQPRQDPAVLSAFDSCRTPSAAAAAPPGAQGRLIHAAFSEQARVTPEALALESRHGSVRYGQLARVARGVAYQLARRGVGPGDVVAIFAERGPALVYALLGVAQSGAAFLILDAAYPSARLLACLHQTRPVALIVAGEATPPEALAREHSNLLRIPHTAREAELLYVTLGADVWQAPRLEPSDLAYLSFTSGSTGQPKGILTAHAPLPHFVAWHSGHGRLERCDRFSLLSGLAHDPLLRDVFTPLSLGASLHIPDQSTIFDPAALWTWFACERISICHLTPALGEILAAGAPDQGRLPALRRMYWGGDVLRPALVSRLSLLAPNAQQTSFYGATETPQAMAYFDVDPTAPRAPVPLGRGIEGAQLLVMRDDATPCAAGETGEIWIRSRYLSLGYLNDPAATAARFVQDPLGGQGDRCYRSGDRGVMLEDGDVAFAGRADGQLKIRGFRVEPGDVAATLEALSNVRRALVIATPHLDERELAAYVVAEGDGVPDAEALRRELEQRLPAYMVPRFIVPLRALPLMPNGKIDVQSLPTPRPEHGPSAAHASAGRAPRNARERELAALWAEVLGLPRVSIDDSFLDLGGDSLSAIRALTRMRRVGLSESVARGIFQGRTIAELCEQTPGAESGTQAVPRGAARVTLLINLLRGLLVLTLVLDHWRAGLFKRLPSFGLELGDALEPLFHLPTPGFAFVFGLGLGHSHYAIYVRNPSGSRRLLRGGATLLGIATLVMALSRNLGVLARALPLDYDLFFTNFFLPTLYYWLALLSAPLWFALLARTEQRWGGPVLGALLLAAGSRVLYELCCMLFLAHEQKGLLQLARLMLTARFSYFNLSTGALLGIALGVWLRQRREERALASWLASLGGACLSVGLASYYLQRERYPHGLVSPDITMPEWLFFVGASLLIGALIQLALKALHARPVPFMLRWLAVVGQCAMPIFILQGVALDVSAFGRALGLPDSVAVAVALGSFLLVVGSLMRSIHALWYGSANTSSPERLAQAAL